MFASLLVVCLILCRPAQAATKWQTPTPEELSMTSQSQVPGAAAVILSHEEIVDDATGTWTFSSRIKILSQAGRDTYSNVSIQYPGDAWIFSYEIVSVAGRTIHSDGTIIPFTGKPFDRPLEHSSAQSARETVFTLPDVQTGSIIEYRYSLHAEPNSRYFGAIGLFTPTFYAQAPLFTRSEHFLWHTRQLVDFTSSLPGGTAAVHVKPVNDDRPFSNYTVDLENVMPVANEPFMQPASTLEQKVVFYTQLSSSVHKAEDFWKQTGTDWSKNIDKFIGSPPKLADAAASITAGAVTPEEKLRKLYAAVQQMKNTDFSRERSEREKKVAGISNPRSASDVLAQRRGDDYELTTLFVGLARAAGFKSWMMVVTDRNLSRFEPHFLTFRQLNDELAIVELNQKDLYLDPGEPFCPFGQLVWFHTHAGGIRQASTGVVFAESPLPGFTQSDTRRVANLQLDSDGHQSGSVDIAFLGAPAIGWRQSALLGDEVGLHQQLEHYLRDLLPRGSDVALTSIENLDDAEKPLVVHFKVSGPLGNFAGKNILVPSEFFQVSDTSPFPATERTLPIEFSYPESIHDAVAMKFPAAWRIDAATGDEEDVIPNLLGATYRVQLSSSAIILHRNFFDVAASIAPTRYAELRNFYEKVITRDHQVILFRFDPDSRSNP